MKNTIIKYLDELLYKARDLALDCQLDLKDSECVGDWRLEVECRLGKAKARIKELEDSIKFLNEDKSRSDSEGK